MSTDSITFTACPSCHAVNKILTAKILTAKATCGKCGQALPFHGLVSEASDKGLMKIIEKSTLPVVVDFWAPWCGPCRSFAPTFETASKDVQGKMVFVKINTEQFPMISSQFNIRGIPTLIIFKNGKEVTRQSGAFPLDMFKSFIAQYF